MTRVAECGTDSGYGRHLRLGEQPCPRCRSAHTDANREMTNARGRALTRLGQEHPDQLLQFYRQEMAARSS